MLKDIINRLLDVVQDGTGARVRYVGQPLTAPQNYPAVYVEWVRTVTASNTFGTRGSDGRLGKRGNVRTHTFNVFVLAGQVPDGVAVDEAQQDTADAVMNAIENDGTLRDVTTSDAAARATVDNCTPYMGEFGFGVQAEMSVIEL
jgi:hypothetical protein